MTERNYGTDRQSPEELWGGTNRQSRKDVFLNLLEVAIST